MDDLLDDFIPSGEPEYAPFLVRALAFLFDLLILGIPMNLLLAPMQSNYEGGGVNPWVPLIGAVATWLYFALMESSEKQATIGKQVMGLKVTGQDGGRISFGRATLRYAGKLLSSAFFAIGYFMAGFTERKQALHDMVAGTVVVRN